ncbi:glucose/galactose MFS transporter [Novacetimonas hansenii]|uniref:Glucose/galactose MFS transporter n=2 Tax=Novacetimonas hansenii TaxID=436 RepID=A0ABQ0SDF8_NOVHA|nr:glucose/galactose MFS transporter [Novacetimonas hansenii]EFG84472.1 glucose/galactose transporter [Novacetimonas hansenii ATCC 23769]GAN84536.1 glucose/galactose transporter [Novacetimonas hansenii JCM 7643]GBQ52850.1 glucose/galactose transporter [Novacetimonas hansenii NRIC 0243]GEC63291.1 glucose/galactose MFS transporter [Novacetimonas hansenii]
MSAPHPESPAGAYGWRPIIIIACLFFIIGFVTWLNGPLITFVQVAFNLSTVSAFLVPMCFYLSYLIFPLPATLLAQRTGLRSGLVVALVIMAVGIAIFGECVSMRWYPGALSGLFVIGAGLSLLQITINPYVTLLGPTQKAAQRIAIMGVANKLAGIVAPIVLAMLVMRNINDIAARVKAAPDATTRDHILDQFAHAVQVPYLAMAVILLVTAVGLARSSLPEIDISGAGQGTDSDDDGQDTRRGPTYLWLGVLCMFVYVGTEVMAGDAIGAYGASLGLPLDQTKFLTSLTLAAMMGGYILGMFLVPRVFSQERYLGLSALCGLVLCVLTWLTQGYVSVMCVALFGFANSMILPSLFPIVIRDVEERGAQATALLVMAFSGGAVLPQLFVQFMPVMGVQSAFVALMAPAYGLIVLYNVLIHRRNRARPVPVMMVES